MCRCLFICSLRCSNDCSYTVFYNRHLPQNETCQKSQKRTSKKLGAMFSAYGMRMLTIQCRYTWVNEQSTQRLCSKCFCVFLARFGLIFGQISWGQKIQCTVLLARRNTMCSNTRTEKTNHLLFTIQHAKHTKLYVRFSIILC